MAALLASQAGPSPARHLPADQSKAHCADEEVKVNSIKLFDYTGNIIADKLADEGAQKHQIPDEVSDEQNRVDELALRAQKRQLAIQMDIV